MEPAALQAMVDSLNEGRQRRDGRVAELRQKANRRLCRVLYYERTMPLVQDDPEALRRARARLERERERLAGLRARLAKLSRDPSNAMIAETLGVTKGTVDAALHALRRKWGKPGAKRSPLLLN